MSGRFQPEQPAEFSGIRKGPPVVLRDVQFERSHTRLEAPRLVPVAVAAAGIRPFVRAGLEVLRHLLLQHPLNGRLVKSPSETRGR